MNKTIQSNSFRSYSESLLGEWIKYFDPAQRQEAEKYLLINNDKNFLMENLRRCMNDFNAFAKAFGEEAQKLAEQDQIFMNLSGKEKDNFDQWLKEKTRKALDVYWAPLSQAATQYTSPAYQKHLKTLIDMEPRISGLLDNLNQLSGTSGDAAITINDVLFFFDELTLIRLAPYTKMALIGIPFRVLDTKSPDTEGNILAGIAHELGHFLYWRLDDFDRLDIKHNDILEKIDTTLKNKLNENQQRGIRYIHTWFEELFADYIGARIAQGYHLKTAKEMVIRNNKKSSNSGNNDYDHVPDILRPLISVYALNEDKSLSLEAWRRFLKDDFPVDPADVDIEAIGENENQRKISRTAEDLSQILLDAIDVISDEIKNPAPDGLFRPHFSNITNIEILSRKANRLAEKLNDKNRHRTDKAIEKSPADLSTLDVYLEPQILEAGEQSHPHTVTTTAHSYSFTIYHTHY